MKTLFLIRHSKSDWTTQQFSDRERPLNQRGLRDAPLMARRLKLLNLGVDEIISSDAVRALSTARIFAEFLDYAVSRIHVEKKLYLAGRELILEVVNALDDKKNTVIVFGHNPGLTEIVEYLADYTLEKLATTGIAMIAFDLPEWKMISKNTGTLKMLDYPKKV